MSHANGKSTIGYLIADLSRLFGRVFDRRAAHLGLTRVQWRALKRIHQSEGIPQSELADLLDAIVSDATTLSDWLAMRYFTHVGDVGRQTLAA